MRNYIATCVIAAASLASCTQNEDFTSQYNEQAKTIKFDVAYVGKNTRATGDMQTADLETKKFILWGAAYQLTTSESGTTEASNGIWITDQEPLYFQKGTNYWEGFKEEDCTTSADVTYPGSNYKTYFTAIAPSDEFTSTTTDDKVNYSMAGQKDASSSAPSSSTRKLTLENIPVVQEINNGETKSGTDYLIACYNGTTEEVALVFKHLLSKLRFAVWTDENTMNTNNGDVTTKIELNSLKIYLPKDKSAKYEQTKHNDVAGSWTWNDYTAPTDPNPTLTDSYKEYTLFDEGTGTPAPKDIKYFASPTNAHETTNWENVGLKPNFFIAPTGESTNAKIYIDIKYTVKRKLSDGNWSSSSNSSESGYSAGHKVVERTKMLVPIGDSSYGHDNTDSDVDADRNEGLSHFHQGYIETLYICLRADQKVTFSTNFTVDGWVDDPINGKQL